MRCGSAARVRDELASYGPAFPVRGDKVQVLGNPSQFFTALGIKIMQCERRLTLASLYLGNDEKEMHLVSLLEKALAAQPGLEVQLLLDSCRGKRKGYRGRPSSVDLLKPLADAYPARVRLDLLRMPQLRGWKQHIPSPFDEAVAVSHLKVYAFDDDIIMTGANLSLDYFSNRQDRYMLIEDAPQLADHYHSLVRELGKSDLGVPQTASDETSPRETPMFQPFLQPNNQVDCAGADTWVFPTVQLFVEGIRQDEEMMCALLRMHRNGLFSSEQELQVATAYFNMAPCYRSLIIEATAGNIDGGGAGSATILTAAPEANGFFNAHGIKGSVPMAYAVLAEDFIAECAQAYSKIVDERSTNNSINSSSNSNWLSCGVSMIEYIREGWTFHAKGMWMSSKDENDDGPFSVTVIGSSNFGQRSVVRDLESQLVVVTQNAKLCGQLQTEWEQLCKPEHTQRVMPGLLSSPSRTLHGMGWKYGRWIRPVARVISAFL